MVRKNLFSVLRMSLNVQTANMSLVIQTIIASSSLVQVHKDVDREGNAASSQRWGSH
jgi:hypothetical protein